MSNKLQETNLKEFFGEKTPGNYLYEDEHCVVFNEEVSPQAPVHFLVVPRKIIPRLANVTEDDEKLLGHMLLVAKNVALQQYLDRSGYHVIVDEDFRSQRLKALHVFGRALHHMLWPVGPGARL